MRLFFGIITFFIILASCSSDDVSQNFEVGSEFINNNTLVISTDTFSIKAGTFKIEELITSNTGRILAGSIQDNDLGFTTAQPYFELTSSTENFVNSNGIHIVNDEAKYDSIGFVMNFDTYYEGDTLKSQTYTFHEIIEEVTPSDDNGAFFNSDSLDYDKETILGQLTFTPKPNKTSDSLYISLSYELGSRIFNAIQNESIESSNDFINAFQGMTIVPEKNNSHILGFNVNTSEDINENTYMRLYYTDEDKTQQYFDFFISAAADFDEPKQFNAIISTDLIPELEVIQEDSEAVVYGQETGNKTYIQSGTGISTRIEFPSIKRLKEIENFGSILGAELTFRPDTRSFDNKSDLEPILEVYIINSDNEEIRLYENNAILSPDPDDGFDTNSFYTLNLDTYVNQILTSDTDLDYALRIQYSDTENTVQRTVIDLDEDLKLSIKYITF